MTVKLVPAIAVKDKLLDRFRAAVVDDPSLLEWYLCGTYGSPLPDIKDNDWNEMQRAVIDDEDMSGPMFLGYVVAVRDPEATAVTELHLVRFPWADPFPFIRAVRMFLLNLQATHVVIRWSGLDGNPHLQSYERIAKRYGGGVCGWVPAGAVKGGQPLDMASPGA